MEGERNRVSWEERGTGRVGRREEQGELGGERNRVSWEERGTG